MGRKVFMGFLATLMVGLSTTTILEASIDRGSIQGTVTDQQGATVPRAKVVVKNVNTNIEVNLSTNSDGFYLAAELVPGKYSVRVSAQGFSPLEINGLAVTAGTVTTADAKLTVGAVSQRVEVTAKPPLVEATPANFTTALETKYIQDVPLVGRDIQALV